MLSKAEAGARLSLAMRIWKKFINWANLNVKRKIGNENQTILIIRKRKMEDTVEQAGTELGQAQLQLELDFTLIKICCITLMITN